MRCRWCCTGHIGHRFAVRYYPGMAGQDHLPEWLKGLLRGASAFKLGRGVLATIVPITIAAMLAIGIVSWTLSANPIIALAAIFIVLLFSAYAVERSFRYAENDPISALFSGGEMLQLYRDQTAARDRAIVVDSPPVIGASVDTVEKAGGGGA